MLIDTHAHLNFKAFKKDLDNVINRAKNAGVEKIIIPGAKIDSSRKAVEISQHYEPCFAAVGIHPHHVDEFIKFGKSAVEEELIKLIISPDILRVRLKAESRSSRLRSNNNRVVAVGEIGLDYHEYKGYPPITDELKSQQKELLILQIEIAPEYNLPIIFHCRDAHDDQLDIIKDKKLTGVFHCFSGEKEHLRKVLDMGFYVGFDGNVIYPENKNLQDLVKYTPVDRLLLETDAPFLTPIPHRGERNEPAYLTYTASFVSQIHKISIDEVSEITTSNALKLFKKCPPNSNLSLRAHSLSSV